MVKAKGMCTSVVLSSLKSQMYAYSIAYVECGSTANAAAMKDWFDNKYADLCSAYHPTH